MNASHLQHAAPFPAHLELAAGQYQTVLVTAMTVVTKSTSLPAHDA